MLEQIMIVIEQILLDRIGLEQTKLEQTELEQMWHHDINRANAQGRFEFTRG